MRNERVVPLPIEFRICRRGWYAEARPAPPPQAPATAPCALVINSETSRVARRSEGAERLLRIRHPTEWLWLGGSISCLIPILVFLKCAELRPSIYTSVLIFH